MPVAMIDCLSAATSARRSYRGRVGWVLPEQIILKLLFRPEIAFARAHVTMVSLYHALEKACVNASKSARNFSQTLR